MGIPRRYRGGRGERGTRARAVGVPSRLRDADAMHLFAALPHGDSMRGGATFDHALTQAVGQFGPGISTWSARVDVLGSAVRRGKCPITSEFGMGYLSALRRVRKSQRTTFRRRSCGFEWVAVAGGAFELFGLSGVVSSRVDCDGAAVDADLRE